MNIIFVLVVVPKINHFATALTPAQNSNPKDLSPKQPKIPTSANVNIALIYRIVMAVINSFQASKLAMKAWANRSWNRVRCSDFVIDPVGKTPL